MTVTTDPFTLSDSWESGAPDYLNPPMGSGVAPADDETDPDAPYGRKPDGTPYKMSAEARQAAADRMTAGRQAKAAARKGVGPAVASLPRTGAKPRAKAKKDEQDPLLTGAYVLVQAPAMLLGLAGRWWPALGLDSLAISYHAQPLAEGMAEMALESSQLSAILTKAATISPGMKIASAVVPLLGQFAANHGALPPEAMATVGALIDAATSQYRQLKPANA